MGQTRVVAIALLVVGLGLLFWGYQESGALGSQMNELVGGAPSDSVMIKYIAGAAAAAVGAFLLIRR